MPRGCLTGTSVQPGAARRLRLRSFGNGKTAIRGGYGIFFEHTNGNEGNTESLEGSPPLVQDINRIQHSQLHQHQFRASVSGPLNVVSIPTKAIWPYVQQWNMSVQRQLPSNTVVTVAYAGSKGTHLGTGATSISSILWRHHRIHTLPGKSSIRPRIADRR